MRDGAVGQGREGLDLEGLSLGLKKTGSGKVRNWVRAGWGHCGGRDRPECRKLAACNSCLP